MERKNPTELPRDPNQALEHLLQSDLIDLEFVNDAFNHIMSAEKSNDKEKLGRKPNRVERIRKVFQGRENEFIVLDDFAELFSRTENPRKSASNAISWLNKAFEKEKVALEIETIVLSGRRTTITFYHLHRLPQE